MHAPLVTQAAECRLGRTSFRHFVRKNSLAAAKGAREWRAAVTVEECSTVGTNASERTAAVQHQDG